MGHIETAVGMFNAGEVLREYFIHYDVGTEDEKARRRSTVIPMVVVYIFGIEVALKALVERQRQTPSRTHDLKQLYGELTATIRTMIEDKLVANIGNGQIVAGLLSHHRNSLQEWRYMGDFQGARAVQLDLLVATLRAIIEVHTEVYGAERDKIERASTDGVGVPPSIQKAVIEYQKDVLTSP